MTLLVLDQQRVRSATRGDVICQTQHRIPPDPTRRLSSRVAIVHCFCSSDTAIAMKWQQCQQSQTQPLLSRHIPINEVLSATGRKALCCFQDTADPVYFTVGPTAWQQNMLCCHRHYSGLHQYTMTLVHTSQVHLQLIFTVTRVSTTVPSGPDCSYGRAAAPQHGSCLYSCCSRLSVS